MKVGITARLAAALTLVSLLAVVFVGAALTRYIGELVTKAEARELSSRYDQLIEAIAASAQQAELMSAIVAAQPGVE
ncbi:MAG TPA: hypothetical protein VK558_03120 [Patescibacteria group bacterium]|nr:hypothetical protein [Patescibacteria group bacterium]